MHVRDKHVRPSQLHLSSSTFIKVPVGQPGSEAVLVAVMPDATNRTIHRPWLMKNGALASNKLDAWQSPA